MNTDEYIKALHSTLTTDARAHGIPDDLVILPTTKITEYLRESWCACSLEGKPLIKNMLVITDAFHDTGVLADQEWELWKLRFKHKCPGHSGGGQVWCAYCGDLPKEEEEGEDGA